MKVESFSIDSDVWNCDRGNILSRNISLKLVGPENLVSSLGILCL